MKLRREVGLELTWPDGLSATVSLKSLRAGCPCAGCRELRKQMQKSRLTVLKDSGPSPLIATSAELVGNYALRIEWSDGHNTGLYSFEQLRELSESAAPIPPPG